MIPALSTTGIGSLPYRSVDAALDHAFAFDIPFLPQLPLLDPLEYMLPDALGGMPGVSTDDEGGILFERSLWASEHLAYEAVLERAFQDDEYSVFLSDHASTRPGFLERLATEKPQWAKAQIAGPITLKWTLRDSDGQMPAPLALSQLTRTVLAKSLALCDLIREVGPTPVIFLDEPGLYAFSKSQPGHLVLREDLRINVMALKKRGAVVGMHCCSDADWEALVGIGLDVLAFDAGLSLSSFLKSGPAVSQLSQQTTALGLGVIPTNDAEATSNEMLLLDLEKRLASLDRYFRTRSPVIRNILARSLLTPACGLAFLSETFADAIPGRVDAYRAGFKRLLS